VDCYIWYSEEGPGRAAARPSPLLAVPNETAHRSTAVYQLTNRRTAVSVAAAAAAAAFISVNSTSKRKITSV